MLPCSVECFPFSHPVQNSRGFLSARGTFSLEACGAIWSRLCVCVCDGGYPHLYALVLLVLVKGYLAWGGKGGQVVMPVFRGKLAVSFDPLGPVLLFFAILGRGRSRLGRGG